MNKITQTMRFRQAVIEYSNKHGVTAAAIRYHLNRQYIYRWRNRYDGTLQSLADRSHRPHSHPNQHTAEEIKLILDMRHRNPNAGIVVFWVKLRQQGYTRSISGLYRFLRKRGANIKLSASKESLRRPQANAGCRKHPAFCSERGGDAVPPPVFRQKTFLDFLSLESMIKYTTKSLPRLRPRAQRSPDICLSIKISPC